MPATSQIAVKAKRMLRAQPGYVGTSEVASKAIDDLESALRELRDYAVKEITRQGAHHDPIWSKVASLLE